MYLSCSKTNIIAHQALAGGDGAVGIDKSARLGIVIAALEVVEAGLGIIVVTPVADGVALRHRAGPFNGIPQAS